jgi:HTH-type transcriptional regulator/antitoxin HigA
MLAGIDNEEQYELGLALYDQILEALPDEEEPIKADGIDDGDALRLLELLLGKSLAAYGASLSPSPDVPGGAPAAILATLLDQSGLTQSDLPEVGSQGVVSELVNGKRDFTVRQIKAIAKRFNIPADYLLA